MKANAAPEKIHIQPNAHDRWFEGNKPNDNFVEYVRKDAFIEKAKKWFEKQNEWHDINGIKHCDMEDFEDFKKYMEGE